MSSTVEIVGIGADLLEILICLGGDRAQVISSGLVLGLEGIWYRINLEELLYGAVTSGFAFNSKISGIKGKTDWSLYTKKNPLLTS